MLTTRTLSTHKSLEFTTRKQKKFEVGKINYWNLEPESDQEADIILLSLHDGEYENSGLDKAYPIIREEIFKPHPGLYETYSGLDRDRGTNMLLHSTGNDLALDGLKIIGIEITGIPRSILDLQMEDFKKALRIIALLESVDKQHEYQNIYLDLLDVHTSIQEIILDTINRLRKKGVYLELHNMNTFHPSQKEISRGRSLTDILKYTRSYLEGKKERTKRQNCLVNPNSSLREQYGFCPVQFSTQNNPFVEHLITGFNEAQSMHPNWEEGSPYSMKPDYISTKIVEDVINKKEGSAVVIDMVKDLFFKPEESYDLKAEPDEIAIQTLGRTISNAIKSTIQSPQPAFSPDQPTAIFQ